jgi:hypothetical protein
MALRGYEFRRLEPSASTTPRVRQAGSVAMQKITALLWFAHQGYAIVVAGWSLSLLRRTRRVVEKRPR